ncbi:S-layer homology domain-containing protein [Paenibacillus sinopodophylli]|uniref:S-layer homology domain-containing protein n=1 Tax=Paenibacillus sinopodophylli TaxID=1837342 RepID=UPI00110CA0AF|nr:S-layer homology domain-containing protein [Paenibacillus sinopodophylli]
MYNEKRIIKIAVWAALFGMLWSSLFNGVSVFASEDSTAVIQVGVSPIKANAENNKVSISSMSIMKSETYTATAQGDRQAEKGITVGDERYMPLDPFKYDKAKKTYVFNGNGSISSGLLEASFQKQSWSGTQWQDIAGDIDKKLLTITITDDWSNLGTNSTEDFADYWVKGFSMAADNGTLYTAYSGYFDSNLAIEYYIPEQNRWDTFLDGTVSNGVIHGIYPSLVMKNKSAYLAYQDIDNGSKATVVKRAFDSFELADLGGKGFSDGRADKLSLAMDSKDDTLYLAYIDVANGSKATVMKFNGTTWEPVGNKGFSADKIDYPVLKAVNGTLYLAFKDLANEGKATVVTWNEDGDEWTSMGNAGFSAGAADYVSLDVTDGTVYVGYTDNGTSQKAVVMKYNGASWESLGGQAGVSAAAVSYTSLVLNDGVPYLAYRDSLYQSGGPNKAIVKKYVGGKWIQMEVASNFDITNTFITNNIQLVSSEDNLYLGYIGGVNDGRKNKIKAIQSYLKPITASADANVIAANSATLELGAQATLQAWGDRQSEPWQHLKDERFVPTVWSSSEYGQNGAFTLAMGGYTSKYSPKAPGIYTVTATFQKQVWDGSSWVNTEQTADKSMELNVKAALPVITGHPQDARVSEGGSVTLNVYVATSDVNVFSYQWYSSSTYDLSDAKVIDGANQVVFHAPTETAGTTYYFAVISDSYTGGVTAAASYAAKVKVLQATEPQKPGGMPAVTADGSNNRISASSATVKVGMPMTLTAQGDRQSVTGAVDSDERFVPTSWRSTEVGQSGSFSLKNGLYTSTYNPFKVGEYTITATFQKQRWNGVAWKDITDTTETKTVNIKAISANEYWHDLGGQNRLIGGFNPFSGYKEGISIDSYDGLTYVAYVDRYQGSISVMMYDGNSWQYVGNQYFTKTKASYTSIKVINGIPYVAYADYSNGGQLSVQRFYGGKWEYLGDRVSMSYVNFLSFDTDDIGNLYAVYMDKYNGLSLTTYSGGWSTGYQAFTAPANPGPPSIELMDNKLYVAYTDGYTGVNTRLVVQTLNNGKWEYIGGNKISDEGLALTPSLLSFNGQLYVAYLENSSKTPGQTVYQVNVKTFDGSSWVSVGKELSQGDASNPKLSESGGQLYLTYVDKVNGDRATALKYTGSGWVQLGNAGFTDSAANELSSVSYDGKLYVAYADNKSSYEKNKLNIMVYDNAPITAQTDNNTVSASAKKSVSGAAVELTANGDRQFEQGVMTGDERYVPISWSSSEASEQAGLFKVIGGRYQAVYQIDDAGSYTINTVFQKQQWNGNDWKNIAGVIDSKTLIVIAEEVTAPLKVEPSELLVNLDRSVTLHVPTSVSDGGQLSYQWYSSNVDSTTDGTMIVGAVNETYVPSTSAEGTLYYYAVVKNTIGAATSSDTSMTSKVTVAHISPPTAPELTGTAGDAKAMLAWTFVNEATGYKIYMSTEPGEYESELATVSGSVNSYTATDLTGDGTTYYFTVKAVNEGGDSPASNEVMIKMISDGGNTDPGTNPGTNPGTGGSGSTTGTSNSQFDQVLQEMNQKLGKLDHLLQSSTSSADKSASVQLIAKDMQEITANITTSEQAKAAAELISVFLNKVQLIASKLEGADYEKGLQAVTEVVRNNATSAVNAAGDGAAAVDMAKKLIREAGVLWKEASEAGVLINSVREAIIAVGQAAVNKNGDVGVSKDELKLEGSTASIVLDTTLLSQRIMSVKQAADEINETLTANLGELSDGKVMKHLTISFKDVGTQLGIAAEFPADLMRIAKESGIDYVTIQHKLANLAFSPDFVNSQKAGNLLLNITPLAQANGTIPTSASELSGAPVLEFHVAVGGETVTRFDKPITMSIPLDSSMIDKLPINQQSKLTVFVLNERTGKWEATGGIYDAESGMIHVKRSHFSVYTVMLSGGTFTDISKANWGEQQIHYLLAKGIIQSADRFYPAQGVTRGELASWLVKALGLSVDGLSQPFKDVTKSTPFADDIAAAYQAGLFNGVTKTTFAPQRSVTREEIATILARALKQYSNVTSAEQAVEAADTVFTDLKSVSAWAKDSVALTKKIGIMKGYEDGSFRPKKITLKQEAAALIYRIFTER